MPTQFLSGEFRGVTTSTVTELIAPKYLYGTFSGKGEASYARIGAVVSLRMAAAGQAAPTVTRTAGVNPLAEGVREGGRGDGVVQIGVPRLLAGTLAGDGDAVLTALGPVVLLGGDLAGSGDVVLTYLSGLAASLAGDLLGVGDASFTWVAILPQVDDTPLGPGWVPGTVNLVRNPSLEYATVGLRDWSAAAGITQTRSQAEATHGTWAASNAVDAGAAELEVVIRSESGLGFTGVVPYVGSIAIKGDELAVKPVLRIIYSDGTTAESDPTGYEWPPTTLPEQPEELEDLPEEVLIPASEWQRITTGTIYQDEAKVVDRIDLVLKVTQGDAGTIWLDAAQTEVDRGQGASSFASGDDGPNYRWGGVPGLSASAREPVMEG